MAFKLLLPHDTQLLWTPCISILLGNHPKTLLSSSKWIWSISFLTYYYYYYFSTSKHLNHQSWPLKCDEHSFLNFPIGSECHVTSVVFVCTVTCVFLRSSILPLWKCHITSWVRKQERHWAASNHQPSSILLTSLSFISHLVLPTFFPFYGFVPDKCEHWEESDASDTRVLLNSKTLTWFFCFMLLKEVIVSLDIETFTLVISILCFLLYYFRGWNSVSRVFELCGHQRGNSSCV